MTGSTAISGDYIGLSEAYRRVGWSLSRVYRMAAKGLIETRNDRGFVTLYGASDLDTAMREFTDR